MSITSLAPSVALLLTIMTPHSNSANSFDYQDYTEVLANYVDSRGLVDYKELQANRTPLDRYVKQLDRVSRQDYDAWGREEQIAFWINAYNGLTLKAIVDNYPIRAGFFSSLVYPKNSIRQIDGVWTELKFAVMDQRLTLDEIEHQILRREFKEPRIHVALVCAALSCPPLRAEPYRGQKLEEQFADQNRRFLALKQNFNLELSRKRLTLSSIFDWFGQDFVEQYGSDKLAQDYGEKVGAVLNYLHPFLDKDAQEAIERGDLRIKYSNYDWTLNEG